jgi:hypothetical protein
MSVLASEGAGTLPLVALTKNHQLRSFPASRFGGDRDEYESTTRDGAHLVAGPAAYYSEGQRGPSLKQSESEMPRAARATWNSRRTARRLIGQAKERSEFTMLLRSASHSLAPLLRDPLRQCRLPAGREARVSPPAGERNVRCRGKEGMEAGGGGRRHAAQSAHRFGAKRPAAHLGLL